MDYTIFSFSSFEPLIIKVKDDPQRTQYAAATKPEHVAAIFNATSAQSLHPFNIISFLDDLVQFYPPGFLYPFILTNYWVYVFPLYFPVNNNDRFILAVLLIDLILEYIHVSPGLSVTTLFLIYVAHLGVRFLLERLDERCVLNF